MQTEESNHHDRGPSPRLAVGIELLRALAGALAFPFRLLAFLPRRRGLERLVLEDLQRPAEVCDVELGADVVGSLPRDRPLRIFVSCAEVSGEIHASGLVRELRKLARELDLPEPEFVGLGGQRLEQAGVQCLANPVDEARMGLSAVLGALPYYLRLLTHSTHMLRSGGIDLCLPVDSPALHVPLGRIAKRYGVPVVHLVTPQYWGWAPWRVHGYVRAVDLGLTILPFEPAWFARAGLRTTHVGHPLLDHLPPLEQGPLDPDASMAVEPLLLILPGSRTKVCERNLGVMLDAAQALRRVAPELKVIIRPGKASLMPLVEAELARREHPEYLTATQDELHPLCRRARCSLAVSGTVLLDLLHFRLPAVVLYRLGSFPGPRLSRLLLTVPWFSSPNLLAGEEVYPEFAYGSRVPQVEIDGALARCYKESTGPGTGLSARLERAAARLGPPGALQRAARAALATLSPHSTP